MSAQETDLVSFAKSFRDWIDPINSSIHRAGTLDNRHRITDMLDAAFDQNAEVVARLMHKITHIIHQELLWEQESAESARGKLSRQRRSGDRPTNHGGQPPGAVFGHVAAPLNERGNDGIIRTTTRGDQPTYRAQETSGGGRKFGQDRF